MSHIENAVQALHAAAAFVQKLEEEIGRVNQPTIDRLIEEIHAIAEEK